MRTSARCASALIAVVMILGASETSFARGGGGGGGRAGGGGGARAGGMSGRSGGGDRSMGGDRSFGAEGARGAGAGVGQHSAANGAGRADAGARSDFMNRYSGNNLNNANHDHNWNNNAWNRFGYGYGAPGVGLGVGLGVGAAAFGYGMGSGWGYGGYGGYGGGSTYVDSSTYQASPAQSTEQSGSDEQPTTADDGNPDQYAAAGEQAFKAGDYAAAAKHWQHAMVDAPNNGVLVLLYAQALFATGSYDQSAGAVQYALHLLPPDQWNTVVEHYTELYRNNQDYTDQLRALETAAQKSSAPGTSFLLGYQYGFLGYPKNAVAALDQVLKQSPTDTIARDLRTQFAAKLAAGEVPPAPPAPKTTAAAPAAPGPGVTQ